MSFIVGLGAPSQGVEVERIDFGRDVQPLLQKHCYKCHSLEQNKGGLRLDQRLSAYQGGDSGKAALVPGFPEKSHFLELVRGTAEGDFMPPKGKGERLNSTQIELLQKWVKQGADWPDAFSVKGRIELKHWAFRKPHRPEPPSVKNSAWVRNEIDSFLLAKLEAQGLQPAAEADPHTLIRRLSLDLTGLPPTPDEVRVFAADQKPRAYERAVDRLMESPAYGERWARVWLDLARYADSKGYGSDPLRLYIWRYRDWVIDAFNRNMPYDQFTIEQLAGDLLPYPTTDQLLATAFHRNTMTNDEGGTDNEEFRVAAIKDRVDTTMQVWMGLTFGCAKCHSHKYDPITQREYYSFYAFFNQTSDADREDDSPRHPTPTPEQALKLQAVHQKTSPLQDEIEHPRLDFSEAQRRWERRAARGDLEWTVLEPSRASALGGTELYHQADHSLFATEPNLETNTYRVEFQHLPEIVTAIRLDLLPVEGSGHRGIGRGRAGGISINDLRVTVQPLEIQYPTARYVRIELPGKDKFLSLAEVQVISGNTNVALRGKASQSSTDFEGAAGRAIDGEVNGDYNAGSVTHTRQSQDPWWEVDIGMSVPIQQVRVWNRTGNALEDRLKGFRVVLLDEQRSNRWWQSYPSAPSPSMTVEMTGERGISLVRATASGEEPGGGPSMAVDADGKTAWSVNHSTDHLHSAVFQTQSPIVLSPGEKLIVHLVQSRGDQTTLARFRIFATASKDPLPALPLDVDDALKADVAERTEAQSQTLSRHYWKQTPEYEALQNKLQPLEKDLASLENEVVKTPILQELPADHQRVTRLLSKGNFLTPGDTVHAMVPAAFHEFPSGDPTNRLGVARWVMDPSNPLTARVAVNRMWAALFSRGIVESEEDFGTQGSAPSHPELLDWLATEYLRLRWDTKALLKRMVSSAAYRQSSTVSPEKLQKDPRNLWLSHAPRPRLEAEMVRDQALALSGLLSRKIHGPSVYPPQPPNLWQAAFNGERNWATSEGEDRYRRGLYTFWRRTVPYPSMITFDAPSREYCTLRRVPSNTPLQAFVTLNDPVFVEAAQALADRVLREGGESVESRLRWGLQLVTARPAEDRQIAVMKQLLEEGLERFRREPGAARQMVPQSNKAASDAEVIERAAWTVLANVLLNLDAVLTKG